MIQVLAKDHLPSLHMPAITSLAFTRLSLPSVSILRSFEETMLVSTLQKIVNVEMHTSLVEYGIWLMLHMELL